VASKTFTWALAAASAAVLLWAGVYVLGRSATGPGPVPPAGEADLRAGAAQRPTDASGGSVTSAAAPVAAAPVALGAPPPGLTAEQWAAVEAELASHPTPAAERARLIAYFTWSDAVQRWRDARGDAALAQQVAAGLPERLAQREVSAAEARQLQAALLLTLEPDEARRVTALKAFDASLPAPAAPDPRQLAFQKSQAALVSAWQARPAAERDPASLARDIEALRRTHFGTKNTTGR
jgi:hypothetical protein